MFLDPKFHPSKKNFGPKMFFRLKDFLGPTFFLEPKFFLTHIFFQTQNFVSPKMNFNENDLWKDKTELLNLKLSKLPSVKVLLKLEFDTKNQVLFLS